MNYLTRLFTIALLGFALTGPQLLAETIDEFFTEEEISSSLTLPEVDEQPQPVRQAAPTVPANLRSVTGYARVSFLIDAKGDVTGARIQRSSDPRFEGPALDAVNGWKFKPAKKGGDSVAVRVIMPMRFTGK